MAVTGDGVALHGPLFSFVAPYIATEDTKDCTANPKNTMGNQPPVGNPRANETQARRAVTVGCQPTCEDTASCCARPEVGLHGSLSGGVDSFDSVVVRQVDC